MILKNCRIAKLHDNLNGKKMICVGVSQYLRDFCKENKREQIKFLEDIAFIVDGDREKWNTKLILEGYEFDIYPYDILSGIDYQKFCILITSLRYTYDIYMKLNPLAYLKDVPCYTLLFIKIKEMQSCTCLGYNNNQCEQKIDKKIHYCWFGNKKIPKKEQAFIDSWKKTCPDYEIIEWNENNYDITKNHYMQQAYTAGKWGFVPDFARIDIVYEHGGIYLDTDVELIRSLDDLLYHEAFFSFEQRNLINLGNGFGAKKGSTIMKELKDSYQDVSFYNEDGTMNLTASPFYQTEFFRKKGIQINNQYQVYQDMAFYPNECFSPMDQDLGMILKTENTYAIHHFACSWFDEEQKQNWENTKRNAEILLNLMESIDKG